MISKADPTAELVPVKSSEPVPTLTKEDHHYLERRELIVTEGVKASMAAARALYEIFDYKAGALWKAKGYKNFADYCLEKWGYERSHTSRLRECGEFVHELTDGKAPVADDRLPRHESQVRGVLRLPRDERVRFWLEITKSSTPEALTGRQVSLQAAAYSRAKKLPAIVEKKPLAARRNLLRVISRLATAARYVPAAKREAFILLVKKFESLV